MTPDAPDPRRIQAVESALKAALDFIHELSMAEAEDFERGRRVGERRRRVRARRAGDPVPEAEG